MLIENNKIALNINIELEEKKILFSSSLSLLCRNFHFLLLITAIIISYSSLFALNVRLLLSGFSFLRCHRPQQTLSSFFFLLLNPSTIWKKAHHFEQKKQTKAVTQKNKNSFYYTRAFSFCHINMHYSLQ